MPAAETTSGLSLLLVQPTMLKVHVFAALAAVALGAAMMWSRKGRRFHRIVGWIWVGLAGTVAVSSLFIVGLNGGHWSWIHILSAVTIVSLPIAVIAARKHDVKRHRRQMMALFYGGFVIAGVFTFIPGRLMWRMVFG